MSILGCALIILSGNIQANYKLGKDFGSLARPLFREKCWRLLTSNAVSISKFKGLRY